MQNELETQKSNDITPVIGYHTLKLLDALRLSFRDVEKEIEKVRGLKCMWDYERNSRLKKLNVYKNSLEKEFSYWSSLVQDWVTQFPEKYELYGDIIIEYYGQLSTTDRLQDVIEEILCEENDRNKKTQNFQAKLRQITLNQIQK